MKDSILEIMTDILKMEKDELLANFDSREIWDSLLRVEILFAVEEEFDIQFDEEELAELVTPQKLCEATLRKAEE
jgi:acyl carrier protein